MLGCLDGSFGNEGRPAEVVDEGVAKMGGVSAFGVGTTRSVFGAWRTDDDADVVPGITDGNGGKDDEN
jgi:hypothetical protein